MRADTFIRSGPDGPEPPRPTDPDPGEPGRAHEPADPAAGFVIDPVTATGLAGGIVKLELLEAVYPAGGVPSEVRADSVRAAQAHPGGGSRLLAVRRLGSRWEPTGSAVRSAYPASERGIPLMTW